MKNSRYFRLLRFAILATGFNTLWYKEGWKGKLIRTYNFFCRTICILQILLVNNHIRTVPNMENWKEGVFLVASSLTVNIALYKSFLFDTATMKGLIKEAFTHDSTVQNSNWKVKKDMEKHGDVIRKFLVFYMFSYFCILFSMYAGCVILYVISFNCDPSKEKCSRILAWPSTSLFSLETHYGYALLLNVVGMSFVGKIVLISNITLASLCYFPTFKLKHLQHVLENFQSYGKTFSESNDVPLQDAEYLVIRECVIEHQKIIRDFEKLKGNTQMLFLIDFITHAMQTAPHLVIIMASDGTIDYVFLMTAFCIVFLICELFMIYWFAQTVIDESINVGTSITRSNWYEADLKTIKLMQLLIIRSGRKLTLRVGPFYDMELSIFIKICKSMYTVVTIFRRNI